MEWVRGRKPTVQLYQHCNSYLAIRNSSHGREPTHMQKLKQVNTWTNSTPSSIKSTGSFLCTIFLACEHLPRMKQASNFPNTTGKVDHKWKVNLHHCPTYHLTPSTTLITPQPLLQDSTLSKVSSLAMQKIWKVTLPSVSPVFSTVLNPFRSISDTYVSRLQRNTTLSVSFCHFKISKYRWCLIQMKCSHQTSI